MAKETLSIGDLLKRLQTAPDTLTVGQLEDAKRLQKMRRRPAGSPKPGPVPEPVDRRRRISRTYRPHLDSIAVIFVRCGEVQAETARQVKAEIPHLKGFKAGRLACWSDNPEWRAAVESARLQASAEKALPPDVRGSKLLNFAKGALLHIEAEYEKAKEEGDEKEKKDLEARLLKIHDALRNEERHQENLKTQAALRSFKDFVANVLALRIECATVADYEAKLREAAKDPAKLMGVTVGE